MSHNLQHKSDSGVISAKAISAYTELFLCLDTQPNTENLRWGSMK